MSEDDLGGKPWGLRWGRLQPRLFVAEADAQCLGLAYQIALGVDILELAGDILERHVAHLAVTQGDHVAKLAAQAAKRGLDAALGRKDAVLGVGLAAALRVAGDGDAGLATGLGFDLLGDVVDNRRARTLGELLLVLLLGQRRVLLRDGTLGDGHDGKAAAGLHAMLDGLDDVVHVVGDLGNQDDVRAARDAGIQRDPANLVAHDLDNEHAPMT